MSIGVNENKATSAPDIKAEHKRRARSNMIPVRIETSMKNNANKLEGSGSTLQKLVKHNY